MTEDRERKKQQEERGKVTGCGKNWTKPCAACASRPAGALLAALQPQGGSGGQGRRWAGPGGAEKLDGGGARRLHEGALKHTMHRLAASEAGRSGPATLQPSPQ